MTLVSAIVLALHTIVCGRRVVENKKSGIVDALNATTGNARGPCTLLHVCASVARENFAFFRGYASVVAVAVCDDCDRLNGWWRWRWRQPRWGQRWWRRRRLCRNTARALKKGTSKQRERRFGVGAASATRLFVGAFGADGTCANFDACVVQPRTALRVVAHAATVVVEARGGALNGAARIGQRLAGVFVDAAKLEGRESCNVGIVVGGDSIAVAETRRAVPGGGRKSLRIGRRSVHAAGLVDGRLIGPSGVR